MANHRGLDRTPGRADGKGGNNRKAPTCGQCGYGLEGLVVIRCPECGHLLDDQRIGQEGLALAMRERVQLGVCGAAFMVLGYFGACMFGLVPASLTLSLMKSFTFTGSLYVGVLVTGMLLAISCVYMLPAIMGRHTPWTKRACEWFKDDYVD